MSPGEVVALFSIALVALVVGFLALETYNAVVALRLRIDKAWANIDVALRQRNDMLPSLSAGLLALTPYDIRVSSFYGEGGLRLLAAPDSARTG